MNCDTTSCIACFDGYGLDNTKKCIICTVFDNNCVNCDATSCTQCRVGYIMD